MYSSAEFDPAKPVTSYTFTRQRYDTCEAKESIARSTAPGRYSMATTDVHCRRCYDPSPKVRIQRAGVSEAAHYGHTDTESELFNLSRSASHCPSKQYNPVSNAVSRDALLHMPDCAGLRIGEDSRLSNPPCNNRGIGINRFEWPCTNPQKAVEIPFDWGIQARTVAKDTHRPCIPTPIDISPSLPMPAYPPAPRVTPTPIIPMVQNVVDVPVCLNSVGGPSIAPIGPGEFHGAYRP